MLKSIVMFAFFLISANAYSAEKTKIVRVTCYTTQWAYCNIKVDPAIRVSNTSDVQSEFAIPIGSDQVLGKNMLNLAYLAYSTGDQITLDVRNEKTPYNTWIIYWMNIWKQ